jgi:hypothetical protein
VVAADFGNSHLLVKGGFHVLAFLRVSKWEIVVIKLIFDVELIELIIH